MNSNRKVQAQTFNDGICDIYTKDEEGKDVLKHPGIRFDERVLGFKRYWTAAANQVQINRVIRIPKLDSIDEYCTVDVRNVGKYEVKLAQNILDVNPQCIDLTLQRV